MPALIDFGLLGITPNPDIAIPLTPNGGALIILDPGYLGGAIAISPPPVNNNTLALLREINGIGETGDYEFAEIQISRGLDQHPSATATYYTYNYPSIEIGSSINLLGINFVIASYNVTHYKSTTEQAYAISFSLVGEHSPRGIESPLHPLDIPIRFPERTTQVTWENIQSRVSTPIAIGSSRYKKYFAPDSEVILTPRSELDAALLLAGKQSLIYSEPTIRGIDLRTGIGSVTIYREYVLDETSEVSIKETPIYINTELELEDISAGNNGLEGEVTVRYEYENCTSLADLQHPGGSGGVIFLLNFSDDLKDPGNVFDNGGRTKIRRVIREKDGNPLSITEETYGYVFISSQLFDLPTDGTDYDVMVANNGKWPLNFSSFINGSISNYWKQVESTTTRYYYDSDGYLTSSRKTGWKLGRLKRESGEYEAANLWINTFYNSATVSEGPIVENGPPPAWKAAAREYNAYNFYNPIEYAGDDPVFPDINGGESTPLFRYSILERTGYSLGDMADYYDDIDIPDGNAPNKFAYRTSSYSNIQEIQPNPKDDPSDPGSPYAPLIAQKERKDTSQVQILIPATVGENKKTPELFVTTDYSHAVEGDHSSSSIVIGQSTQYSGRPSVHTKLPDPVADGIELPPSYAEDRTYRYFLNSVIASPPPVIMPVLGGGRIPVPYSSISFSGAITPEDARSAAENSLIKKSMDVYTTQIRVMFFQYYQVLKEGMKCTLDGQEYMITNISYNLKLVENGLYYCPDGMNVSLSAIPQQSIFMSRYSRNV